VPVPVIALAVITCLVGGTVLIVSGARLNPPGAAPLPVRGFTAGPGVIGKLPPLNQGRSTTTGGPGGPCRVPVTRSRLVIGSLSINSPVVPADRQPGGALTIPSDVREVGMWTGGAPLSGPGGKPVKQGTTLLTGHVDYAGQGNGALYRLYQVQPGATVCTSGSSGPLTRWQVTSLTVVAKSELPAWVFAGPAGPRKLVIVTCGGPVDYIQGYGYSYRDNVIAAAVPG
jgi:hypothetical protein